MLVHCANGSDKYIKVNCLSMMIMDIEKRKEFLYQTYCKCEEIISNGGLPFSLSEMYLSEKKEVKGMIDEFDKIIDCLSDLIKKEIRKEKKNVRNKRNASY